MTISELCQGSEAYIIEKRRYLHRHPEVSRKEFKTSELIREELTAMGIPFEVLSDQIAVVATIKGGHEGRSLALRADMDALPVTEESGLDFASETPGVAHACGHDAHVAMLLGAARVLQQMKDDLHGTVRLIFQSAEELGLGVKEVLDYFRENGGVDQVIGLHVWSAIPAGQIKLKPGPLFTGGNAFYIHIYGKGGHGARPDLVKDPVKAACDLVLQLSAIPVNYYDVLDNSVVSVGMVQAGSFENVFPPEAYVTGTTRHYKPGGAEKLKEQIRRKCEGVATIHDVRIDVEFNTGVIPVINDEDSIGRARALVSSIEGLELCPDPDPIPAGDNIGFLIDAYGGFYGILGGGIEGREVYGQHHPKFAIDESVLRKGCEFFVRYTADYLS